MSDVNTTPTSLLDAINISLSCLGETPVEAPNNPSTNVILAKQIIEEVSRDTQSKGWWFNTSGGNISIYANSGILAYETFSSSIPEEARRYISIRAARVFQSRFVGSEELYKFSFQEEQVSLAVLTQAHVRNGGNSTSFTAFPAELKNMGIEEVMFLQQSAEEKLLSLRLKTELKTADKLAAETALIGDQEDLVEQQVLTEVQETTKRGAEKELIDAQKSQVYTEALLKSQQALTELENTAKVAAEASLIGEQEDLIEEQALTEVQNALKVIAETSLLNDQETLVTKQGLTEIENALKVIAETSLINDQEALVVKQALTEVKRALDVAADTTLKGKQGLLLTNQTATELKTALKLVADTTLVGKQGSLVDAQAVDVAADTTLKGKQGSLIDAQRATEVEQAQKVAAEASLVGKQGELTDAQKSGVLTDSLLKSQQALTELENTAKVTAETSLIGEQEDLLQQQYLTEVQETTKRTREAELIDAQEALLQKQILTEAQQVAKVQEEVDLLQTQDTLVSAQATTETSQQGSLDAQATKFTGEGTLATNQAALITAQKDQLIAQTAIEVTAEKAFYDGVVAGTQTTYRDFAAELRIMAVQEATFQSTPAYKKVEMLKDAAKLRLVTATETGTDAAELLEVNKVMRFIGESPVTALNSDSLASECVRLLRDTDTELQGRGWDFNITKDTDNKDVITQKALGDTPQKYREYLSVRVAILMTELYPQSGVDIQRLPKMELELRAYFKDREFDNANYSVFDNYDTASRIGINRNYDLI